MKTGIHIEGGKPDKQAVEAVADAVVTVFRSAHDTRMDQETVRTALGIVREMGAVSNVAVTGCSLRDCA